MKKSVILLVIGLICFSCNDILNDKKTLSENLLTKSESIKSNYIVLKERNPRYPWIIPNNSSKKELAVQNQYDQLEMKDLLGRGWRGTQFFNSITEDISYPVIDMEKLLQEHPSYFSNKSLNVGTANSFSYSSFERYVEKSNVTNKISSGFSINLGLFSLGSKKNNDGYFYIFHYK